MQPLLIKKLLKLFSERSSIKNEVLLSTFFILCFLQFSLAQQESSIIKLDKTFNGNSYIEQDHFGYMWISDSEGIYKYDGYDYTHLAYKDIFGDGFLTDIPCVIKKDNNQNLWFYTTSGELTRLGADGYYSSYKKNISNGISNQITSMCLDHNDIWFGSKNGIVYKYNHKTLQVDSIFKVLKNEDILLSVKSIALINKENLFLSTLNGELYTYNTESGRLSKENNIVHGPAQNILLTSDLNGKLWVATELEGLIYYDVYEKKILKQYGQIDGLDSNIKYVLFISIYCDTSGTIWGSTDGGGLYKIKDNNVTIYKHNENNSFTISSNTMKNVSEDSHGNIWVATKKGFVNKLLSNTGHINFYSGLDNNIPLDVNPLSILKSSDGSLWIGTDGKGLNRVLPDNSTIQYHETEPHSTHFKGKYITKMVEDSKGNIWISTYQNGLWVYNLKTKQFTKIETTDSQKRDISDIRFVYIDSENRIWAALFNAFYVFSEDLDLIGKLDYETYGLFGNISESIIEDENGTIWVGVLQGGLFSFNENQTNFNNSYFSKHNYYIKENNVNYNYNIKSISPDYKGVLWITCTSGILIKYELETDRFESLDKKKGFEDIRFRSVLVENPESIWLSSNAGIHHYNIQTEAINSYYQTDGFISNNFLLKSSFQDNIGQLYFGSEYGVNVFDPSQISKKESLAKLYINDIEILNKPAHTIIPDQLNAYVENIKSIQLNYNQSSFSFHFSAIDDVLNTNYYYAYRLKGFDNDWIFQKDKRTTTYTNIPYGNYTFEIKAGSKKGNWNIEPKAIDIHIYPPWWHTTWAYVLYFILASFIAYSVVLWLRLRNRLVKETWHNNKEKELYALKMNFFAKMSHEIQTPLTLILGPIGDMLERAGINGNQLLKQRLIMINNNANRLSRIAMELMTVRNKELGKLRLFASRNDLIKDLKKITLSFSEQARFKNVDFIQKYPEEVINIWYDRDKIEHVVYNLLSNAFKFTPKEGRITLKVIPNSTDEIVEISVTDSGPGIPKEELEDIFKLFYQTDLGKHSKGIGIGLALTKELISLHHGKISVNSSAKSGTQFTVKLSTEDTVFSENEKVYIEDSNHLSSTSEIDYKLLEKGFNLKPNTNSEKKHTLLIVEDNIEMQIFLQDVLSNNYNLILANNGKEGIAVAGKNQPDLIISDIMMPLINGLEMCKALQKDRATSHIPIILLTAKNTTTTRIKGLKYGAIEYIQKPFNFHELLLKINNIIDSKEKTLLKYKTDLISLPEDTSTPSKDDLFIEHLVKELNNQVENPDFKLEELSRLLNMSYSVVYRKCHSITGKTLVEFVRTYKIKKATLLIIQNGFNVSEAAFMVGYKDSKYFTKCFKEEFGVPPASLKREAQKIGVTELLKKYNIELLSTQTP